jgi:hypothetical protein
MENYSAIKKNEIMSSAGKCIEPVIIMMSEICQAGQISRFHSFLESGSKIMMMVVITIITMGHECIWDTVWGKVSMGRGGYLTVKRMEVHYVYTYEDSIMKPTNECLKKGE